MKRLSCKRSILLIPLILCLAAATRIPVSAVAPAAADSTEILAEAAGNDGKTIVYTGEIIGDVMRRENGTWINVSDGSNALGIFISDNLQVSGLQVSDLQAGTYRQSGDRVQITGIFHRACPDHGGDIDIHATSLTLVSKSQETPHDIRLVMAAVAMLLLLPVIALLRIILKRNHLWSTWL
jgi:hypothetical protein